MSLNFNSLMIEQNRITPPSKATCLIYFSGFIKTARESTEKETNNARSTHLPLKLIKLLSN